MHNEVELECPFCGKRGVKALYFPSYLQAHTSRISSGAKTTYTRVPERHEIITGCRFCGKGKKEVKERLEGKVKKLPMKEKIERLKKLGIPTVIESEAD